MPRWSLAPCNCKVRAYTIASIVIVAAILGAPLLDSGGRKLAREQSKPTTTRLSSNRRKYKQNIGIAWVTGSTSTWGPHGASTHAATRQRPLCTTRD